MLGLTLLAVVVAAAFGALLSWSRRCRQAAGEAERLEYANCRDVEPAEREAWLDRLVNDHLDADRVDTLFQRHVSEVNTPSGTTVSFDVEARPPLPAYLWWRLATQRQWGRRHDRLARQVLDSAGQSALGARALSVATTSLKTVSWFMPRSARTAIDAACSDLRRDVREMEVEGRGPRFIAWSVAVESLYTLGGVILDQTGALVRKLSPFGRWHLGG
jgi:hypothetical protein